MPDPLRVVLVEDEPYNRKRLSRLLREAGCEVAAELPDGLALLEWLKAGGRADAAFLDIEMPGPSGLEIALDLPRSLPVVFVTAYAEHAVRAFEAAALDYLVKPATSERLAMSLARLRERIGAPAHGGKLLRVPLRAGTGVVLMELGRISHFEVVEEVVWAFSGSERHRTTWKSLTEAEAALPPGALLRGHRHLLIRPEAVIGLRPGEYGKLEVRVQGGHVLQVSRGAAPALKQRLGLA